MSLTIGGTFFLRKGSHSIWSNGADQNCVFLVQLLRLLGHTVIPINGGDGDVPPPGMMFGELDLDFVRISNSVVDTLDVLIEAGAQVSAAHVARVHARGGKVVAYRFGNAFVIDSERIIHGKSAGSIFNGARFDEVWTNPQHEHTCASYWETTYRCPVYVLPHIWEPTFIHAAMAEMTTDTMFGYLPGKRKKRISVFEPNFNIVKTAIIPMVIADKVYRKHPELIEAVYVTNALQIKEHETFKNFANCLDIGRMLDATGKSPICSFEGRYNTPWFLAKHTDVVVAHHWECGLNYAYYDALYGSYPLVHNSDFLPQGVGYHYTGFDATSGARALLGALEGHDKNLEEYEHRADAFLDTVRIRWQPNLDAHDRALKHLNAA